MNFTKPDYIHANWVNNETWHFLSSLSFHGYYLAGNSIANMYEQIPLQGDLDFWVCEYQNYILAFKEMCSYYTHFNLYPSLIEMIDINNILPRINLIYTCLSEQEVINKFDFPYCKCSWSLKRNKINIYQDAIQSIRTKTIMTTNPYDPHNILYKRIYKACQYNYQFTQYFWFELKHLIKNSEKIPLGNNKLITHVINLHDLDMSWFELHEISITISDKTNIQFTLLELYQQYQQCIYTPNTKLPILIQFQSHEIRLMEQYIDKIISLNPLSCTQYLEIHLDNYCIDIRKLKNRDSDCAQKCDDESQNECVQKCDDKCKSKCDDESQSECDDDESKSDNGISLFPVKTYLLNTNQAICIQLNNSGSAYILIDYLPKELCNHAYHTFESMWNLHPNQRHKIIFYQNEINVSRYSKSYLNTYTNLEHVKTHSYMYSGYDIDENNDELPELFQPYYQHIQKIDNRYNQAIANWYENENDYIAQHSDCQLGMIQNSKISICSFYPNNDTVNYRCLDIIRKKENHDSIADLFKIRLDHGSIVTMCGNTQDNYTHGIAKNNVKKNKRISLSFRQMIE